ncbi:MAG: dihydropteroate synthase [Gammaproteobacteria bacterium]|nr:dihydropteroate synthase [Gammaproteobacteria bacterium]
MSGAWWHPAGDSEGPLIMGILNLTPDSFSDGGRYLAPEQALAHGLRMAEEGADIIDVGGESTRPGAERVPAAEQCRRVLEVIRALRAQLPDGVRISIDTSLGEVATAAVRAGADMLNDVSAGRDDPGIFALAANRGLPLVLMHMRGTPRTMQEAPRYDDVVEEVRQFLLGRVRAAVAAGVPEEQLVLDPGIGFGKTVEHNLALLRGLRRLATLGCPLLLGASRKRFMQAACGTVAGAELVGATCATTALGVWQDVRIFRVHDVRANRQAAALSWRLRQCAAGA